MNMSARPADDCLPSHGRVACTLCHRGAVTFDVTRTEGDGWRITANPLAWGNSRPEVLVLGFSKGPTQAGALATASHDEIAFKGARRQAYEILLHIGLVPRVADPAAAMGQLIRDRSGRFAFGSLVRCTVERWNAPEKEWTGTGGGMLDRFIASAFGRSVAAGCTSKFLGELPIQTRLVVLYGLGTKLGYVDAAETLIRRARPSTVWRRHDEVSYGDDRVTFVHTEHFRAQGKLIPNWLGATDTSGAPRDPYRAKLGQLAAAAVARVGFADNQRASRGGH